MRWGSSASGAARQRPINHADRVFNAVDCDERAEARTLLLPEQHLIEHVEPVERDAGAAVLRRLLVVEERLAPPDLVYHVLDLLGRGILRQLRQRVAQVGKRDA